MKRKSSRKQIERKYYPYMQWEDYKAGMWRDVNKDKEEWYFKKALNFTGNAEMYGKWMMRVILRWPNSCEQNLMNIEINRQAWIGQAACCLALKCPEHITRMAWNNLTIEQQDKANIKADIAIKKWEKMRYEKVYGSRCIHRNTKQSVLGV